MNYLIVPGFGGSHPDHWQSRWELANSNFSRVHQSSWDVALCSEWLTHLDAAVAQSGPNTVLIGHSLGCLLIAKWATQTQHRICGALLVAIPDPSNPLFPADAIGFDTIETTRLPFPSLVIASSNDPYASLSFSKDTAKNWGSGWKNIGACGHINVESGFGDWPAGLALLTQVLQQSQIVEPA